jgi:hypothetical protein
MRKEAQRRLAVGVGVSALVFLMVPARAGAG